MRNDALVRAGAGERVRVALIGRVARPVGWGKGVDRSPEAITLRLRRVSELRALALRLAASGREARRDEGPGPGDAPAARG